MPASKRGGRVADGGNLGSNRLRRNSARFFLAGAFRCVQEDYAHIRPTRLTRALAHYSAATALS
jgi:hypothetical protein